MMQRWLSGVLFSVKFNVIFTWDRLVYIWLRSLGNGREIFIHYKYKYMLS